METTKVSLAEQLKAELMERYGLREDQVRLTVTISTLNTDLGRQVLSDFDKFSNPDRFPVGKDCDSAFGEHLDIWVHRKDGRYGQYITEGENDES